MRRPKGRLRSEASQSEASQSRRPLVGWCVVRRLPVIGWRSVVVGHCSLVVGCQREKKEIGNTDVGHDESTLGMAGQQGHAPSEPGEEKETKRRGGEAARE